MYIIVAYINKTYLVQKLLEIADGNDYQKDSTHHIIRVLNHKEHAMMMTPQ